MICYKDRTFCGDWENCANGAHCERAYNKEVREAAAKWWGEDGIAPIAVGSGFKCFRAKEGD